MTVQLRTPYAVIDELPSWCGGVLYDSTDDTITLRARSLDGEYLEPESLPMTPAEARALVDALTQCLTAADRASKILDVSPSE